jgi:hypothetical protein
LIDTLRGFALAWNRRSRDLVRSGPPRFEIIPPGVLTVSDSLYVDSHHCGAATTFAFSRPDRSARAWCDEYGLGFEASLPATMQGMDVHRALTAGLRLGVSVLLDDLRHRRGDRDDIDVVQGGVVRAISIMAPGRAFYADSCCWLASAPAATLPPDVEAARRRWREPSPQRAVFATARRAHKPLFNIAALSAKRPPLRWRVS